MKVIPDKTSLTDYLPVSMAQYAVFIKLPSNPYYNYAELPNTSQVVSKINKFDKCLFGQNLDFS